MSIQSGFAFSDPSDPNPGITESKLQASHCGNTSPPATCGPANCACLCGLCSDARALMQPDTRTSARWHMKKEERVYIMYGDEADVRALALAGGYTDVEPSGHYAFQGNRVVDPKDGPTSFEDNRRSGGGSRG